MTTSPNPLPYPRRPPAAAAAAAAAGLLSFQNPREGTPRRSSREPASFVLPPGSISSRFQDYRITKETWQRGP
ncbi:hypothetical protein GUJ93_ZPchr0002g26618 [Zizania palustris]|uniref:Uncharacterized protein n=1 Tax=Zizania palustris TaxID=103762 RepID=A0A8J5SNX3_ZIZPA|nr:hypothetical protein GUJ93_ZPchr0002g26618 [Zizania palustris]